jgi:hypothetical protein
VAITPPLDAQGGGNHRENLRRLTAEVLSVFVCVSIDVAQLPHVLLKQSDHMTGEQ